MGTWIAEQITCKLIASSVIEEGDRELYSYGFFLLISKIFFFFVAVIAGLLTDTTVESIIFYVVLPRDGSNTVTGSCVCQWLL